MHLYRIVSNRATAGSTMWSRRNRSKMMPMLTTQHYRQMTVIVAITAFVMQTLTMAAAQSLTLSSTTPKLVNGASAAAATNQLSNCSIVRSLFESQGINGADIPQQPITGKFCLFNYYRFDLDSFISVGLSSLVHFRNLFLDGWQLTKE